ncbi:GntR family transcriptional regulator [Embleya hyalina]|uniref:GntR family transcriptional regulator n=1 Tax=Embleya hyalina TaxID=516124 RepID=UPI0027D9AD61|nr:winged helix-turn-helix domain-containing protein [Embleya hyalina]
MSHRGQVSFVSPDRGLQRGAPLGLASLQQSLLGNKHKRPNELDFIGLWLSLAHFHGGRITEARIRRCQRWCQRSVPSPRTKQEAGAPCECRSNSIAHVDSSSESYGQRPGPVARSPGTFMQFSRPHYESGSGGSSGSTTTLSDVENDPALWPHENALRALTTLVESLSPGSPLPSERVLSEQYGVARNTLRRALSDLEDRGLIEVVKGRGRLVRERPAPPGVAQT